MKSLVVVLILIVQSAFAKEKLECTTRELARMDCRLTSGTYNIRILPKTIAWNDGTWHTVDPMPLNGEAVAWEKLTFQFLNGWPILQLWLWEKGFSETEVQSLHWYVADAEKRKFTSLAEGVVRKRRLEPVEPEPEPDPRAKKPPKKKKPRPPKYLYDPWETYSLKPGKGGILEWNLNSQKKIISKVSPEIAKPGDALPLGKGHHTKEKTKTQAIPMH